MKAIIKGIGGFLLSLIVVFTMINLGYAETPKRGGDLKMVGWDFPPQFNSAIRSGITTMYPGCQLFASLLDFDDKWQPVPYLAKSWEISDDGLTYTFHLVENATFHDGKPITSEDVAFSLDIVKHNHPFGVAMFKAVDRVETPDPHTAVFKLSKPHPAILLAFSPALMPVIPKHIYNEQDHGTIRKNPANLKPIGSGPFKFAESKAGEYWIFERNENFFRRGRPYLNRIIFSISKDPSANEIAYKQGAAHYGHYNGGMNLKNISRLQKAKHLVVTNRGYEAVGPITFLEFNLRKPPFNDIRVRRAIAHAVDKEFIAQKLHLGLSRPAHSPLVRMFPFYTDDVKKYEFDLEKANKMLDDAGYPRKADGTRFSATMHWYPDPTNQRMVAEYLKPALAKIGVDVQLCPPPDFGTWVKVMANWEHELSMNAIYSYGDPVIGVHRLYLCDNIKHVVWTNTEGYCNPKADEILTKAGFEMNLEKRKALYGEWQRIVTEDLPLVWTHEMPFFTIYHKDLRDVPMGIWGGLTPFDRIYWKDGHAAK